MPVLGEGTQALDAGDRVPGLTPAPGSPGTTGFPAAGSSWAVHLPLAVYVLFTFAALGFYNASDDGGYLNWVRAFHVPDSAYHVELNQRVARITLWLPPALVSRLGAPVYGSAVAWVL